MKKFDEYTVVNCTAIAIADDEDRGKEQEALLVSTSLPSGEVIEFIVFGYEMPKDASEWDSMCKDPTAWEARCDAHHACIFLALDEIFDAIENSEQPEYDEGRGGWTYFLNVRRDGEIVSSVRDADAQFHCAITSEWFYFHDDEEHGIYDYDEKCRMDDPDFHRILVDLACQANEWLDSIKRGEA